MKLTATVVTSALAISGALAAPAAHAAAPRAASQGAASQSGGHRTDLGRQTLAPDDGWAAAEGGTTGGAAAAPENVVTVRTRQELAAAVAGDTPKIVYVRGHLKGGDDCDAYADPGYSLDAYLEAYDPAHWSGPASGPLEEARKRSTANQRKDVVVRIGSNTTIVGAGGGARLTGINLTVQDAENVIIRNLDVQDAYDCFPGWSGEDWKTEFDNITVSGSRHVWVDHVTLGDGDRPDSAEPKYFGKVWLHHDGLLDVVNGSDLVTVSWSKFADHDKSLLWGNSDSATGDRGKLRVTLHHNEFRGLIQRVPRVRYGRVHVYNNSYVWSPQSLYAWGAGKESAIYAQNNHFSAGTPAEKIIYNWGGTAIHAEGTYVGNRPVDALAAFNAANDPDLSGDVGWTPTLHGRIDPAPAVPGLVRARAGAGRVS